MEDKKIMKIAVGADHGGVNLKKRIVETLVSRGYDVKDFGTFSTDSVDYPDIAKAVCTVVSDGEYERGLLVCGTGIGMSMTANKVKNIRAAVCDNTYSAKMCRAHNNANVLCMGERVIGVGVAFDILDAFLDTDFEGGRHQRRVDKINELDNK